MRLGVGEPPLGVGWGVGARWSEVASCGAVSGIWPISPEISCRTPILATHPQGPIRPLVGPNPRLRLPNVRLMVGETPLGVGWGVGVRWPRVAQFQAKTNKSGILAPESEYLK